MDASSNTESVYHTPPLSSDIYRCFPGASMDGLKDPFVHTRENGHKFEPSISSYNVPGHLDKLGELSHANPRFPVEERQMQHSDNDDDEDGTYDNAPSNMSASLDEIIDQVSRHFGAQFELSNSDINEETNEQASNTYAPSTIPRSDLNRSISSNDFEDPAADTEPTGPTEDVDETQQPQSQERFSVESRHDLPLFDYQRPIILLSDPTGRTTAPVADDSYGTLLGDDSLTPTSLVEQVLDILHALNEAWMQKLASTQDLYRHCQQFSTCSLFEKGIRTLQQCFLGTLPTSFEEIFGLMHIAFAFSLVINKDGGSYYWDGFSSDLRRWHHTMKDSEIGLFARVWDRLWCPQASAQSTTAVKDSIYLNTVPRAPFASLHALDSKSYSTSPTSSNESTNTSNMNTRQCDLYSIIIDGMVIKGCSNFLDVVAYAAMARRNAECSSMPADRDPSFSDAVEYTVTRPLTQCRAIRDYWGHIMNTQFKLRNGFVRNIHEFELMLISRQKGPQLPRSIHSRFTELVTFQCDEAMGHQFPGWRNGYHITNLDLVLSTAIDLEGQGRATSYLSLQGPSSSSPAAVDLRSSSTHPFTNSFFGPGVHFDQPTQILPFTSVPGTATHYSFDSSNPTTSSLPSLMEAPYNHSTSSATSVDTMPTHSPSLTRSISVGSSQDTGSVTKCNLCPDKVYKGTLQSRKRSLRRHMETEHGLEARVPCPVPGCDSTFGRGRPDNVKRHVDKVHPSNTASIYTRA